MSRASQAASLTLLAILAAPSVLRAESLADAWQMALQSDATLAATRSDREAAEADHAAARRQRWPALDLNGAYTQFDNAPMLQIDMPGAQLQAPLWKHDGYAMAGADLSVPLWTSGRISGAVGAAAAGAREAAAREMLGASDLKLAVAESYVAVIRARKTLEVAQSSVRSLTGHANDVQIMYENQAVARSDLLSAQVALANATLQQLRAANALHLATAAYNRWVSQPLERVPDLEEPRIPAPQLEETPLQQLMAHALQARPEIAALGAQQSGLEQAARVHAAAAATEQAEENLRIAKELYGSGLANSNQVLDAETLRVVARSNQDEAALDIVLAHYRLERAVGGL